MNFDIDSTIFIGFLAVTMIIGLFSSRGSNTIRQYAIGDRNFSTATIVATIVATWISGSFFYTHTSEVYTNGLYPIWAFILGDFLSLFFIGLIFAPRMGEFLGKLSIAEAMGSLFGERVRVITAIASFIGVTGLIAIQLKLAGLIFEYALDIPHSYGVLIATVIITLYSSLGGVKAVTFTDVIQFFTFGFAIPITAYTLLTTLDNLDIVANTVANNPLFDYKKVFDFSNPLALKYLFLFLFCMTPSFSPQYFQRIAIARNTVQAGRAFILAAITCFFLTMMTDWIGVLVLSKNDTLSSGDVVKYIIFNSSYVGLKGMMLAGVMAMIMSTADSCINSTAVIIVHDFFKPLKMTFASNEIFSARIISGLLGTAALGLSLHEGSLLELFLMTTSFYMVVVSTPFIMAVLGFRSTEKSVISGMVAGLATVIMWDYIFKIEAVNSIPIGMLANLIFLIGTHYLFKQSGGWIGIQDKAPLMLLRLERKRKWQRYVTNLKNFSIIETCRKNSPKGDGLFSILGFFIMISTFSSTHTLAKEYQSEYAYLIDMFYPMTLFSSAALISYPLWLEKWKASKIEGIIWNIIMFFLLICFNFLMVLISNFSGMQMMVFMVSIIILSALVTWSWALFNIILGVTITSFVYHQYIHVTTSANLLSAEFKIIYLLLMVVSTLVIFLKPKQQYQELTEERNEHLSNRIGAKDKEVQEALALKAEFIRNINHEYHAPMTGIMSMAEGLQYAYDKISDEQKKKAIDTIVKSSYRLKTFDENIVTLARLSKPNYELNKEDIDFSQLIYDRVKTCRKLYDENKEDREFIVDIVEDIKINADKNYIIQLLDNLIINSISYCKKGQIKITLSQYEKNISFVIEDEGIGIPGNELSSIFEPFMVSSKTKTPAGGRGVGLAICKRIAEVHSGSIRAESNGEKGTIFRMVLPK